LHLIVQLVHVSCGTVDDARLGNAVVLHVWVLINNRGAIILPFLALGIVLLLLNLIDILRMANILSQIGNISSEFSMRLISVVEISCLDTLSLHLWYETWMLLSSLIGSLIHTVCHVDSCRT
jgi:hypothetical protein